MTQKEFEKLDSVSQYKWIIENKSHIERIDLDNDVTYIVLNSKSEDVEYLSPMTSLGNDWGVINLLTALGFEASPV